MTSATLLGSGYELVQACDGREALQLATEQPFDLVITDVNMPNMDGIALVRALRALANYRSKPLLLLTTEASATRKAEAREAGASAWMLKPFNAERLLATVARFIK